MSDVELKKFELVSVCVGRGVEAVWVDGCSYLVES